ncbi:MAG: enoyl-CoA hydratase/isomerase family protein [Candidatus Binataceae bacterium]
MSDLIFEKRDHVAYLTLNRPDAANALNAGLVREINDAVRQCEIDADVRAVLLTGAGKMFCGGGDLKAFASQPPSELPGYLKEVTHYLHGAIAHFARMRAPVIVAVNGNAGGGGMSLACAGDIVLAGESSRFTLAYTRVGLTLDGSSSYFLPRVIGLRRTMELALTSRTLSAQEAQSVGLITRVVADAALLAEADKVAKELASGATLAYGGVKRLMAMTSNNTLEQQMELESTIIAEMGGTRDGQEGISAFLAKRAPKFQGQ